MVVHEDEQRVLVDAQRLQLRDDGPEHVVSPRGAHHRVQHIVVHVGIQRLRARDRLRTSFNFRRGFEARCGTKYNVGVKHVAVLNITWV